MPIHMECPKCMNVATVSDESAPAPVNCPHCQQPMIARAALPASNVLIAAPRTQAQGQGLSFDIESAITLSVFALLLVSAVLFYMRF